eukprot:96425-Pelagomonas_calceolata.AAC.3
MLSVDCMLENELCVRFVCRGVPSSPRSGDTGTQLLVRAHDARQLNNLREQMARGHAAAIRNAEADFCELVIHRCIPWRSAGAKGASANAAKRQRLAPVNPSFLAAIRGDLQAPRGAPANAAKRQRLACVNPSFLAAFRGDPQAPRGPLQMQPRGRGWLV